MSLLAQHAITENNKQYIHSSIVTEAASLCRGVLKCFHVLETYQSEQIF